MPSEPPAIEDFIDNDIEKEQVSEDSWRPLTYFY